MVNLLKKEQKSEEYLKINPAGVVPAVQDKGVSFGESTAIMKYICSTRNVPMHLYPRNDLKKRAIVDQHLEWC